MGSMQDVRDEELRLDELSRYRIVMEEKEEVFCELARLAMLIADMPFGGVSLVDQNRVWLKGRVGVDLVCLEREGAFCAYAVESGQDTFIVPDTLSDPRFVNNPLVTAPPNIRHYAGANLIGQRGYTLGTLWVMDTRARQITATHRDALLGLAAQVVRVLEMRYEHPLTKLPTRSAFVSNLQCAINQQQGSQLCRLADCPRKAQDGGCGSARREEPCLVGYIRLRNLPLINSAYGRECGDGLLVRLGECLRQWVGPHNLLGHPDGDNLVFALFDESAEAERRLDDLLDLLSKPVAVGDALLHVSSMIGLSRFPESGRVASSLLDQAAAAAIHRTDTGATMVNDFADRTQEDAFQLIELQKTLVEDLRAERLVPYYQPQIDVVTGRVVGFEALARLRHPKFGLLGPNRFIPFAEQSGLVREIDLTIFKAVCRDIACWRRDHGMLLPVAANLSRNSLTHPGFANLLAKIAAEYELPAGSIELEITESGFSANIEAISQRIAELRAAGFMVSIDDFGTGLSNLSTLRSIRFDQLKADRQYVHGASINIYVGGILRFIKSIADLFSVDVMCEGVEDAEDVAWISSSVGCRYFQGWFFSPALAPEVIPDTLKRLARFYAGGRYEHDGPASLAACLQVQEPSGMQ